MVANEIFMKSTSMVTDLKAWNAPCSEKLQHAFGKCGLYACIDLSLISIVFLYMQRSEALRVIGEAIDDVVATALIPYSGKSDALCFPHCSYAEKHLATVMDHLQSQGLWPLSILRQHPLDTTIHKTRSALTSVDFSALSQCGAAVCIGGYLSPIDIMRRQLIVGAEEACNKVKKVSLDRTRAGKLLDP